MQAQMRGGFGGGRSSSGGGGRVSSGGFSGNRGGFAQSSRPMSGPRVSPGFRGSPGGFSRSVVRGGFVGTRGLAVNSGRFGFNSRPFFNHGFGNRGFVRFRHRPFFVNSCFGAFGCDPFFSAGFFGGPFFPGYYGFYPGFYSDYAYPPPPPPQAYYGGNDVELSAQVQHLSDQVEDLRDEQQSARSAYPQPAGPGSSTSAVPPASSTIFVFRDGRRITARNYAITGQTLWIFDEHVSHRYLIADLDRAATEQMNSGVELRLPAEPK